VITDYINQSIKQSVNKSISQWVS